LLLENGENSDAEHAGKTDNSLELQVITISRKMGGRRGGEDII
jgi:hypothetical protein